RIPASVAGGRAAAGGSGRAVAVAPAGRGSRPARDQARPGGQPGLAVHLVVPVPVVRLDGVLPARALPGVPDRLAGAGPAHRRDIRADAGERGDPATALAPGDHQRQRVLVGAGGAARRGGRAGLAVPDQPVEDGSAGQRQPSGEAAAGVSRPPLRAASAARAAGPNPTTSSATNSAIPVSTYRFPTISC